VSRKEEIAAFMAREFPQSKIVVESIGDKSAIVRHKIGIDELRPGNTVAGPVMMGLADAAIYVAILGELGLVALAVTTNLNINFLRKPRADADIIARCALIKTGTRLAIGEVFLYSEGDEEPVAHAVGTYSIPPPTSQT
jgi:acyl-coenzyme A thioesterase PaaI-like protein